MGEFEFSFSTKADGDRVINLLMMADQECAVSFGEGDYHVITPNNIQKLIGAVRTQFSDAKIIKCTK